MKKSELKEIIKASFLEEEMDYKKEDDVKEAMRGGAFEEDDVKKEAMRDKMEDDVKEMMRGGSYEEDEVKEAMRDKMEDDIKEQEDVDVDVDEKEDINVDVEKDVDIDDVSKESDIEVKSEIPGESADVSAVLGLLTKAQERAESMGDEKLMDQIGNTITYYTRTHVVKSGDMMEEEMKKDKDDVKEEMKDKKMEDDVKEEMKDKKMEDDVKEELTEEVKRFKKLAGLIS